MQQDAENHKFQGNIFFKNQQYEEAIKEYSTAIIKNPKNIVYYTNRALCNIRLRKFEEAIYDCKKAIDIDKNSLKGNYLLGQAIIESSSSPARLNEAIKVLRIAYDQSIRLRKDDSNEIAKVILKARKKKYEVEGSRKVVENSDLMDYLIQLMENDRQNKIADIRSDTTKTEEDVNNDIEYINYEQDQRIKNLKQTFLKADPFQKDREAPDYLFGKIHFNIMLDPVITPSGITYDRTELREHFEKIGYFDPLTRKEITEKDLVPNLALREAIEDFLDHHGWANDE
jgi:STIP1 family protein 1